MHFTHYYLYGGYKGDIMLNKSTLGLAVTAALAALSTPSVQATQPTETIVITASKIAQPISDVLASVEIIDRQAIESSVARDLPTLLQGIGGVDVVRKGGLGQNSSIFIRGAASSHSLVLVDGVRVGSGSTGYKSLSTVPLNAIERIEVIKGSRAAWYGSDALAGVINIITRKSSQSAVTVTAGSNNYRNAQATITSETDALSLSFNAGYEKTDGFDVSTDLSLDRDGYENKNAGLNAEFRQEALGTIKAVAQFSQGYVQYDSSGDDLQEFDKYQLSLAWDKNAGNISHQAQLNVSQDQELNTKEQPQSWNKPSNYQTDRQQISYQATYQHSQALTIAAGLDYHHEDLSKSVNAWAGADQPASGFTDETRHNLGAYAGAYYNTDEFIVNAAVRRDDNSDFDVNNTYNISLGLPLTEDAVLRFTQGSGFKAPSFNNASSIWITTPDLNLLPEESLNRELGLAWYLTHASLDIALFRNDIDNLIQWTANGPENVAQAQFEGLELSASFDLFTLDHQLNFTYLKATDGVTDTQLILRPKRSINWDISKQFEHTNIGLGFSYRSDRSSYYHTPLTSYTLVNLSLNHEINDNLKVNARVDNLTDKQYFSGVAATDWLTGDITSHYIGAERQFYVGLDYRF